MIEDTFVWTGKDSTETYDLDFVNGSLNHGFGRPLRNGAKYHIGVIGTTSGKYYSISDETYPAIGSLVGYIACPNVGWFQQNFKLIARINPETMEEVVVS